jgi:hypothetical protein
VPTIVRVAAALATVGAVVAIVGGPVTVVGTQVANGFSQLQCPGPRLASRIDRT